MFIPLSHPHICFPAGPGNRTSNLSFPNLLFLHQASITFSLITLSFPLPLLCTYVALHKKLRKLKNSYVSYFSIWHNPRHVHMYQNICFGQDGWRTENGTDIRDKQEAADMLGYLQQMYMYIFLLFRDVLQSSMSWHTINNTRFTKRYTGGSGEKNRSGNICNVAVETICNNPLVWLLTSRVDHLLAESKKRLHNSMKLYGEDLASESNLKTICKGRTSQLLCCMLCLSRAAKTRFL